MIKIKDLIDIPSLNYHVEHGLTLHENVYRYSSEKFISLFKEAREALRDGKIQLNEEDLELLESTDIGEYGEYEGKKVPLDLPMLAENVEKDINQLKKLSNRKERYNYIKNFSKEKLINIADELYLDYEEYDDIEDKVLNSLDESKLGEFGVYEGEAVPLDLPMVHEKGAETAWEDGEGNKITLQDILDMTKSVPQKDYPTEKLAKVVLDWDNNPEEVERIEQVEVSKQYPILIMVDEAGKIQWILDGNHRAQKALRSKAETIPAKLIKPSMLDAKAKKVLLGVVDGDIDEAEYRGKDVPLNKPKRGGSKKFVVYTKNDKGNVVKVSFGGTTGLNVKIDEPGARASFAARHKCAQKKDKTKPGYWACNIGRYWKSLGGKRNFSGYW